jgi:thymidylate kinase
MENFGTQLKVRKIYLEFVARGALVRIDGNKPKNDVAENLYTKVLKFLETSKPR